jgi:hypothetical protein
VTGNESPWSVELDRPSLATSSWSAKKSEPVTRLTSSSLSPPPPVRQFGRLRASQVGSSRSRKLFPPSSERLRLLVWVRELSGQSTKIRFGLTAPLTSCDDTWRSIVSCGSPPRKCAETSVGGANVIPDEVLNATFGGVPGGAGGERTGAGGSGSFDTTTTPV